MARTDRMVEYTGLVEQHKPEVYSVWPVVHSCYQKRCHTHTMSQGKESVLSCHQIALKHIGANESLEFGDVFGLMARFGKDVGAKNSLSLILEGV